MILLSFAFLVTAVVSFVLGGFLFAPGKRDLEAQLAEVKFVAQKYGYTAVRKLLGD